MDPEYLDRFSRLDSPVHRLPAAEKLVMALALAILVVALPSSFWIVLVAVFLLLILVAAVSRIPWGFLLRRILWLEPLVLGVALLAIFQPGGWRLFLLLAAKCTLCLFTMILLSNTTPFSELLRVFKRIRVPSLMITTLALMYRYLFVLIDETQRMRRARASRTFARGRRWSWRNGASVIGQLFVRMTERAERIYAAMCARGWQ